MPGPPPTPLHLKLLRGNPGQRRLRAEVEPTKPKEIPQAPDFLGEDARAEWDRLAPELHALGLLRSVDVNQFAAYCMAYERWRAAELVLAEMAKRDPAAHGLLIRT